MALWNLNPRKKPLTKPLKSLPPPKKLPTERPKSIPKPRPEPKPRPTKKPEKAYDPRKEFLDIFGRFSHSRGRTEIWRDFIVMSACSISNSVDKSHYDEREAMYLCIIQKYQKLEQELFPRMFAAVVMALERNPNQDFLGELFMSLNLSNSFAGQFFTPYHVCSLMAKATMNDISEHVKEKGYITINDPCCGAGAILIAGINEARDILMKENLNFQNHVLIVAQDIDAVVAMMCYIQISLLGVAGVVKVGNSLTDPFVEHNDTKDCWFTPMYFSDVWVLRRIFRNL